MDENMTPELKETLLRLKNECSYILPMDEEARQKEISKLKEKEAEEKKQTEKVKSSAYSEPKIEKPVVKKKPVEAKPVEIKASDTKAEIKKDEKKNDTSKANQMKSEKTEPKKNVEPIKAEPKKEVEEPKVVKEVPAQKIKEPEIPKADYVDFDEEEVEDEDFDDIVSILPKHEPEKPKKQVIEDNTDKDKNYIEAEIQKGEKSRNRIKLSINLDENKPNPAPKVSTKVSVKNNKHIVDKPVDENADVEGVKIVHKQDKKILKIDEKIAPEKTQSKASQKDLPKGDEDIRKVKKTSPAKSAPQRKISLKTAEAPTKKVQPLREEEPQNIKRESTPKEEIIDESLIKVRGETPAKPSRTVAKTKPMALKRQSAQKSSKAPVQTRKPAQADTEVSGNDKNDRIVSRRLNLNSNKLADAKAKARQTLAMQKRQSSIGVPQSEMDGSSMLDFGHLADEKKRKPIAMPKTASRKPTSISVGDKKVKIRPINEDAMNLYYDSIKDNYNVYDSQIESQREAESRRREAKINENAYAKFKQSEVNRKMNESQKNKIILKDFKKRKK